MKLFFSLILL